MSDEDKSNEQMVRTILIGSAVVSVGIGFASGSVATAIGSFMVISLLFVVIAEMMRK